MPIFCTTGHSQGQLVACAATAQHRNKVDNFEPMRPWKAFCGLNPFAHTINGSHRALVRSVLPNGVNSAIISANQHGDDLTRNEHDQFTFHALIRITGQLVRVAFTSMLIEITGSELVLINLHDTRCAGRGEVSRVGASHHDEVNVASMPGRPARHSDMAMTGSDMSLSYYN
jgi:hypothetical protein